MWGVRAGARDHLRGERAAVRDAVWRGCGGHHGGGRAHRRAGRRCAPWSLVTCGDLIGLWKG